MIFPIAGLFFKIWPSGAILRLTDRFGGFANVLVDECVELAWDVSPGSSQTFAPRARLSPRGAVPVSRYRAVGLLARSASVSLRKRSASRRSSHPKLAQDGFVISTSGNFH